MTAIGVNVTIHYRRFAVVVSFAGMKLLSARSYCVRDAGVGGSNPLTPTIKIKELWNDLVVVSAARADAAWPRLQHPDEYRFNLSSVG